MKQISTLTSLLTLLAMMVSPALYGQWSSETHANILTYPFGTALDNPKPFIMINGTWMTDRYGFPYTASELSNESGLERVTNLTMRMVYNESNYHKRTITVWATNSSGYFQPVFSGPITFSDRRAYSPTRDAPQTFKWHTIPSAEFNLDLNLFDFAENDPFTIRLNVVSHNKGSSASRVEVFEYEVKPHNCDRNEPGCIIAKDIKPKKPSNNNRYPNSYEETTNDLNEQFSSPQASLWPNPVNDILQVEYSNTLFPVQLNIYNSAGQRINVKSTAKAFNGSQYFTVDTRDWIPGVYFIKLTGQEGVKTLSFSKNP